jgi:hypothetical protein|tara:strand:- start:77 stop:1393 length:1317 start_codon:yes stop_codon:yes gene_type:complete
MEISQSTANLNTGSNDVAKYIPSIVELFQGGEFNVASTTTSSSDTKALEEFLVLAKQNKKKQACAVPFKAANGKMYVFGQMKKPKVSANMGDVAEGVFAAAVASRFLNRNSKVNVGDVFSLLHALPSPTSRAKGKVTEKTYKADNKDIDVKDDVKLYIALASANMSFLLDSKSESALNEYAAAAVKYANDEKVTKWAKLVYENGRYDKIEIIADGLGGQQTTKVDVLVKITDDKNVMQDVDIKVSLKAGDVKQFGQQGGTLFEKTGNKPGYKEYWNRLFGIDVSSKKTEYNKLKEIEHDTFGAVNLLYDHVADVVQRKLDGDDAMGMMTQVGKAIDYYATSNEEHVELVQLSRGDAKIYSFGNLANVITQQEWEVEYKKGQGSGGALPIITIHKKGDSQAQLLILRVKVENIKGAPYFRNYVEKGRYLTNLIGRYASA